MIYKYVTVGHQRVKSYFAIILNEISLNTSFRKLQCFVSCLILTRPPNIVSYTSLKLKALDFCAPAFSVYGTRCVKHFAWIRSHQVRLLTFLFTNLLLFQDSIAHDLVGLIYTRSQKMSHIGTDLFNV